MSTADISGFIFRQNFGIEFIHTDFFRYTAGDMLAVSGHHDDMCNSLLMQFLNHISRFLPERIINADYSGQFVRNGQIES